MRKIHFRRLEISNTDPLNVEYNRNNNMANTHASVQRYSPQYKVNKILDVGVLSIHKEAATRFIVVDMILRMHIIK